MTLRTTVADDLAGGTDQPRGTSGVPAWALRALTVSGAVLGTAATAWLACGCSPGRRS
ncbi:hypothetical protein [Blastococcus atacamensis]|uniref:hypothetical protein n=1 Tax=Blastococcus atacamensis TaxID=2070508 RepID=UPI0013001367|nr:hypothetical protein [Blastococcus atacamensis]